MKLVLATLLLLPLCGHADTWRYDSEELARFAAIWEAARAKGNRTSSENLPRITYFQGFVQGVPSASIGVHWCPPDNMTNTQAWAIAANYLRQSPQEWNKSPSDLVLFSLSSVYPCPRGVKVAP